MWLLKVPCDLNELFELIWFNYENDVGFLIIFNYFLKEQKLLDQVLLWYF